MWYILDDRGEPVCIGSDEEALLTWARWFEEDENRVVQHTELPNGAWVSTIFLGFDNGFPGDPDNPILWETMLFYGRRMSGLAQYRNTTRTGALVTHAQLVDLAGRCTRGELGLATARSRGYWRRYWRRRVAWYRQRGVKDVSFEIEQTETVH